MDTGSTLSISTFLPEICLAFILLFLSGFFSLSETALFSLTREVRKELRAQNSFFGRIITSLLKRPKSLLITLLFGNMTANVAFFCMFYGVAKEILHSGVKNASLWAGIISGASLLTIIIFGEVIPKNIAVRAPVQVSKTFAIPILFFDRIFMPFRIPLDFITDKISYFFSKNGKNEENLTVDELKMIVEMGEKQGLVDETEHSMISAVLDLQEKQVKEAMVPRVDMAICDVTESVEGFLNLVRKTKYTKIPVYKDDPDTIIGIVYAKEVFLNPDKELREFVRPIQFIPSTKTIESLLQTFRSQHKQMAIVIDEYGGTDGLVTLEDILEEIVGEIDDEHDRREKPIKRIADDKYYLPGNLGIREWCDYFEVELESPDFDTIGGLVISLLGNMPKKGDVAEYGNMRFTVDTLRKRRIISVIMTLKTKS